MRILFLDDNEERHRLFMQANIGHNVFQARSYDEAVKALEQLRCAGMRFDVVSLDHDLSYSAQMGRKPEGEKTGLDVVRYITSMPEFDRPTRAIVHSFNPIGAQRMVQELSAAGVWVDRQAFGFGPMRVSEAP